MSIPINPETKVGALLEAYPGIEEQLIAMAPEFARLKNPVLRKTVARVATLEQAAKVGGIPVRDLVRRLREAVGQEAGEVAAAAAAPVNGKPPAWLREERVRFEIDADSMLKTGEHPIGKVRECVARLEAGEVVRLTSSFRPEPLLEVMRRGGNEVYSAETSPGRHVTYILGRAA
jgi:hypothetical protein